MDLLGDRLRHHIDMHLGATPSSVAIEETLDVQAARFDNVPSTELVTSITIGVSGHVLRQAMTKTTIRQELMTCVDQRYADLPWHEVLFSAAKIVLARHTAFLLGEVVGPAGPLFPEAPWCTATALLCAPPAFFDSVFSEIELDNGTPMVFVELIPITTAEAKWVKDHGWSMFFEKVNGGEVDIMDLTRA
jgi:hypothetical protein